MSEICGKLVVIDDDREMRALLKDFLETRGYAVLEYSTAIEALNGIPELENVDAVISDIKMPGINGLEFTSRMTQLRPEIPILLITAFGSIETAIEAMQRGAFHYIVKPFKLTEIAVQVERAVEHRSIKRDNALLRKELRRSWSMGHIIGKSAAMQVVLDLIRRVSQVNANVLITGESGSGKEVVARAIHDSGTRSGGPFIAINCTAIPDALLESELFGHAKGAFTGANQTKRGLFEEAHGGTLFLDEIGDMNPQLQTKILRVLQERRVRPLGELTDRAIDVRIIAATHKDLREAIREGRFREDLYYRLNVIPIPLPPLRNRVEDIPLLAEHFREKYAAANHLPVRGFSKQALSLLCSNHWPGNVRELENAIERAVVLCNGPLIELHDLQTLESTDSDHLFTQSVSDFPTLAQLEERYMRLVLEKTGGKKDKTSQILGINRRTLYRKEREYGLKVPEL